jgi:hypothetical protein
MNGYGVQSIHTALQSVQHPPSSSEGSAFELDKRKDFGGSSLVHVAPASAQTYGSQRFTQWDASSFGANRGSASTRRSFVDFGSGSNPFPQGG